VFIGVHLDLSDRRSDEFGISERVLPHDRRRRQWECARLQCPGVLQVAIGIRAEWKTAFDVRIDARADVPEGVSQSRRSQVKGTTHRLVPLW
jgi:hypothetical protein